MTTKKTTMTTKNQTKPKMKPRGNPKALAPNAEPDTSPGDNTKYSKFLMEISRLPKVDKADVKALEQRFYDYLNLCAQYDMKIGNQAAYLAMGITKDDVYDWEHRGRRTPEHADLVKKVRMICSTYRESLMAEGKINPVVGIFWQKNYDGMKDQQEMVLTPNSARLSDEDAATIVEKYKELPDAGE